jgi:hypothetical protein
VNSRSKWRNPRGRSEEGRYSDPELGPPRYGAGPPSAALTVAARLQIVQSALWAVLGAFLVAAPGWAADLLRDAGVSGRDNDLRAVAVTIGLLLIGAAAAMIVLAVRTLRLFNGARVTSVGLQLLFGALWLVGSLQTLGDRSGGSAVVALYMASCIAVAGLLSTRSAKAATAVGGRGRGRRRGR